MTTVAREASNRRPSAISRAFERHPRSRLVVVVVVLLASVVLSFVLGRWRADDRFAVNTDVWVAAAGLFIVALAIERLTELLVAPWVGRGDPRLDRNVVIGCFALLIGVLMSGLLGLRLLALLRGDDSSGSGWWWDNVAPAIEVFATGLAIGAGSKPLHDLISRLDKSTTEKKRADADAGRPPVPPPPVPPGGSYRQAVVVDARSGAISAAQLEAAVAKLLPQWWVTDVSGSFLVHHVTACVPGSTAYVAEGFAAAHRLHGAGFDVTVPAAPMRVDRADSRPARPRRPLEAMGVTPQQQREAGGGAGVVVGVLDTGLRVHPDGVDPARLVYFPRCDVLDEDDEPTDPLLVGPDWLDRDLMGAPGHGTGTAACAGAGGDAALERYGTEWWERSPMVGVAPEATIAPYRVMRGPVHLLDEDVAEGVRRASEHCDVLSMSLGGLAFRDLRTRIDEAVDKGIIVVCAAGNEFGVVIEPASYPTTIAVASVNLDGTPYEAGSSRGPEITISAPGVDVLKPDWDRDAHGGPPTATSSLGIGTSYATAHVAGVAALWLSHHGRDALRRAYPGKRLSEVFAYLLATTATPWADADLTADWGPGAVDVAALLAAPVFDDDGGPLIEARVLDHVFDRKAAVAVTSRFASGVASVLTGDGAAELRANLVDGLFALWSRTRGGGDVDGPVPAPEAARERSAALLRAELQAHAGANPDFRRALASTVDEVPVPAGATDELQLVLEETNRFVGTEMPKDFSGLSAPLRRALQGRADTVRGYRWVGVTTLVLAVLVAMVLTDTAPPSAQTAAAVGGALALLGLGLYGGAQAIERLLEFTVGRIAFKNVPGRETDRALILLGAGFLVGTLAAVVLQVGLLEQVATETPGDGWFARADVLVTGLALGGGAKPLHDLLTQIRIRGT